MKKVLITVLLAVYIFSSCGIGGERVKGNGNYRTIDRNVSSFSRVEVHGSIKVNVAQGDQRKLQLEADENLLDLIETRQDGDRLVIETRDGYNINPSRDIVVHLTSPVYKEINVSGACDIIGQGKIDNGEKMKMHVSGSGEIIMEVDAPSLEVGLSGSGAVNLRGETKDFDLDISGAANAHCYDLLSENTKVTISGAGDAQVYASVKLDANVSGAGSITYQVTARDVKQQVSGAGSVTRK
jgi:hypothetical protein